MANIKAAQKAIRVSSRKRVHNDRRRRTMRALVKEINEAVEAGDIKTAEEKLPQAYKAIDKACKRGVIKKNTATRKKAHLARRITTNKQ